MVSIHEFERSAVGLEQIFVKFSRWKCKVSVSAHVTMIIC